MVDFLPRSNLRPLRYTLPFLIYLNYTIGSLTVSCRIDGGFNPIPECPLRNAIFLFLRQITSRSDQDGMLDIAQAFAGEIFLLETRLRRVHSVAEALSRAFLRNYYLAIWHEYRDQARLCLVDDRAVYTPLIKLILSALSAEPGQDFKALVRPIAAGLSSTSRLDFLRDATVFEHFTIGIGCSIAPLLTVDAMASAYGLDEFSADSWPEFSLCELPPDFLGFMRKPDVFNIANNNQVELALCLLTGSPVIMPRLVIQDVRTAREYLQDRLARTFSAFLMLTGPKASTVRISSLEFELAVSIVSCYTDPFGDENPGFERQDNVSLSLVRLKRIEDIILSGAWTGQLPPDVQN
jgi:hypothetical protein